MYFYDTYAICEIIEGNPSYSQFGEEAIVTSVLNLGELYYGFLKKGDKSSADQWLTLLTPHLIEIDSEVMRLAMLFRYAHKKRNLSMVDCVGYLLAQKHGLSFLTGDKEFANMPNVEFVK